MGIALEETGTGIELRLEGAIDIGCAAELKSVLTRAIGSGRDLCVSLEGATYLDVTAVQLLWAAREQARRSGIGLLISDQTPQAVTAALAEAGFPSFSALAKAG